MFAALYVADVPIVLRKSSGEHFGKIAENAFSRSR
jgi:hypothetical protein